VAAGGGVVSHDGQDRTRRHRRGGVTARHRAIGCLRCFAAGLEIYARAITRTLTNRRVGSTC
jgi:hypothetical protein